MSSKRIAYPIFRAVMLTVVVITLVVPFLWMVLSSFKSNLAITDPKQLFSFNPTLTNYETVFGVADFLPFMINSLVIGAASTVVSLIIGVPASWVMARYQMTKSSTGVLVARIIPTVSLLIPWYYIFAQTGLAGTYTSLILAHMFVSLPLIVWIMLGFFEQLPIDLEESGQVDGLTPIGAFWRITLRLSTPGLATAGILSFIFSWNNFMFALILSSAQTRTLPIALYNFISYASIDWGGLMAASVTITLPVCVFALIFQRYVVAGLTAGSMKG
ncbi:MAG: carbohydrate ABC transporter permease [Propionibacteriaceae bacterium]|jgi:multiple sugar transport system permease protein|nr:carbohydrate ABC transporter permease [Propionibacteriaceae bacterium]